MTRQWIRQIEFFVGVPGEQGKSFYDFQVAFSVTKSNKRSSNKSSVQIWNLNETSRSLIEKPRSIIAVRVGYLGSQPSTVLVGDVRQVTSKRAGEDIVTEIEAGDGERAINLSSVNEAFAAGTTNIQLLQRCVDKMGIGLGHIADMLSVEFTQGYTAVGSASDLLDDICDAGGCEWSIQDGLLQVLKLDTGNNEAVHIVNEDTGLVGSPEKIKGKGKKAKRSAGVKFTCLLKPSIKPGSYVRLESEFYTGFFLVKTVRHQGDYRSDPWYSEVEAVDIQAAPEAETVLAIQTGVLTATDWWDNLV